MMADVEPSDVEKLFAGLYEHSEYYTIKSGSAEQIEAEWGDRWRYVLAKTLAVMAPKKPRTMLDVGSGNGYLVHIAGSEFGIEATGVEPAASPAKFARETFGVAIDNCFLHDHKGSGYSIITTFNVIEHTYDPDAFLKDIHDRLEPGGYLVIATSNPRDLRSRLRKPQECSFLTPPHNINLFTRKGLLTYLENSGFVPEYHETISTFLRCIRGPGSRPLKRMISWTLKALGLGGDVFVIARKA